MLAVDYYEKIGELVAGIVLNEYNVSIYSYSDVVIADITVVHDFHRGEAKVLWVSKTGALSATIAALEEALEGI